MAEEQRRALAALFAQDAGFKAAIVGATSPQDAVRIAREHGIEASIDDFTMPPGAELGDAELGQVAGGVHPKYGTFTDYTC